MEFQEKVAQVYDTLHESIAAFYLTKSFQLEKFWALKLVKRGREFIHTTIRFNLLTAISSYTTMFIGGLGPLIVLWYGGKEVMRGNLSLGTLVAFSAFLGYLFGPAQRLTNLNSEVQKSLASLERIFELFDVQPEIQDPKEPEKFDICEGKIIFDNVSFSYDTHRFILKDINLVIEPHEIIALVGKSGAGKTTLVSLIP